MRTSSILRISLVALTFVLGTSTAPTSGLAVLKIDGEVVPGSYIVKLKDGANKHQLLASLQSRFASGFEIKHEYDAEFYNGFSGSFDPQVVEELVSNDLIEYVSEDALVYTTSIRAYNSPWGLQRISHPGELPRGSDPNKLWYTYDYYDTAGRGVNIYVVDTGIHIQHQSFGGRASYGWSAFPTHVDGNGHGTHCAGTAAGTLHGVARGSKIIGVKVLSDQGSGSTADIIAGINYVVQQHSLGGRQTPTVISMSLGGPAQRALDQAVAAAVSSGVHTVVAAGNDAKDANGYSPARVPTAITVGAINISGARTWFTNWGSVVDVYAPGENIISTWIGSTSAIRSINGTSMATPHVAGVAAMILSYFGNLSTDQLTWYIKEYADKSTSSNTPVAQIPWAKSFTKVRPGYQAQQIPSPPVQEVDVKDEKSDKEQVFQGIWLLIERALRYERFI
ncbi:subtilisin-like serine protease [Tulasnella sp. 403]|nr:subtilisin-like serine protease [Tulasnella sp. 403]